MFDKNDRLVVGKTYLVYRPFFSKEKCDLLGQISVSSLGNMRVCKEGTCDSDQVLLSKKHYVFATKLTGFISTLS